MTVVWAKAATAAAGVVIVSGLPGNFSLQFVIVIIILSEIFTRQSTRSKAMAIECQTSYSSSLRNQIDLTQIPCNKIVWEVKCPQMELAALMFNKIEFSRWTMDTTTYLN